MTLSPADQEALRKICETWISGRESCPRCRDLAGLALRRMEEDLLSNVRDEVIEELRREIEYRQWRAENAVFDSGPLHARKEPVSPLPGKRTNA